MPKQIGRNFVKEETRQSLLTSLTLPCLSTPSRRNRVVNVTLRKTEGMDYVFKFKKSNVPILMELAGTESS